jgi:hypothetical protein
MIEYVILGTSHKIQSTSKFDKPVIDAIGRYSVTMVAEEYTNDDVSTACVTAKRLHIPYLQVDLYPQEWPEHGIEREMRAREGEQALREDDCRFPHADRIREDFWLERIQACADGRCVLVICGYLHVNFLAQRVEESGGTLLEKSAFPAELIQREPTMVLSPLELEEYLRKRGGTGV